jgi:hypothetical protein
MSRYALASYWDERYAGEPRECDWYLSFADLAPYLARHLPETPD